MYRKLTIISGIALVLLLGGAFAYTQINKTPTQEVQSVEQQTVESSASDVTKASLMSLFGKNVTCTSTDPEMGESVVFVSGENIRADFNNNMNGKNIPGHMIKAGETTYVWDDEGKEGTKFTITKADLEAGKKFQGEGSSGPSLDKEVDLKCSDWSVDNSKFSPPADVKFTDMTKMMQNIQTQTGSSSMPKMDASICNQITDSSAKAQCLKAIGN